MSMEQARVLVDRETAHPWVEVAHSARLTQAFLRDVQTPNETSRFAQVDALYPSQPASRWCRGYLTAALEHLIMWADFAAPLKFHEEQVVIHALRPAQALARAAAESAAQAVWIMAADGPIEAVHRHLTLVLHDLDEQRKAVVGDEKTRLAETRKKAIEDLAKVTSVDDLKTPPSYLRLMREASGEVIAKGSTVDFPKTTDDAERIWRASAGAMHGKRWPSLEQTIELPNENGQLVMVPDPEAISKALKLADGITTYGILRFADYSGHGTNIAEMLDNSLTELAKKLPLLEGASLDLSQLKTRLLREAQSAS
jgi:hypothetical protein